MEARNNVGSFSSKACTIDIVPATSVVERKAGEDRYDTASQIAGYEKTPLVYIASGENYPDALSAAAIAAERQAPLLLTTKKELPYYIRTQLSAYLKPENIVVVGGEAAISADVITDLNGLSIHPTVTRIAGVDRFEVSRNLITHPTFGAPSSSSVFVATGLKFPDALSASPAAARNQAPVLLVNGLAAGLTSQEKALLVARGVTSSTLIGGDDTVSSGIAADIATLGTTVTRLDGDDRFATSAKVVSATFTSPVDTVYFATGSDFPDALAGGVLAGRNKSPVLLVRKDCVTAEVAAQVRALAPKHLVLLGGPAVLDATLENLPLCS
nr:cell wall-binding repeat-containing protein [Herbiconiux sp. VKM Ac-2851]